MLEVIDHGRIGDEEQRPELTFSDWLRYLYFVRLLEYELLAELANLLL